MTIRPPSGQRSQRIEAAAKALVATGFRTPIRPGICDEIWVELWGNLASNPINALTFNMLDRLAGDPCQRELAPNMMLDAQAVGEALGLRFAIDVDQRIAGGAEVGAHCTSMLQDLERGCPDGNRAAAAGDRGVRRPPATAGADVLRGAGPGAGECAGGEALRREYSPRPERMKQPCRADEAAQ